MSDADDTEEDYLAFVFADDEATSTASTASDGRVEDLTVQIEFLDSEVARYSELVEQQRLQHATELANQQLRADTKLDDLRREERLQTQTLHDSYRYLINERQLEFDAALHEASAAHAVELAAERERYAESLEQERNRSETQFEASHRQAIDELTERHAQELQTRDSELRQATETITRLESELAEYVARAQRAEIRAHNASMEITANERRVGEVNQDQLRRINKLERSVATATRRLEAERRRSAATLAELLERSATVAAEADKARSTFASEQAKAEHAAMTARQRAEAEYTALAEAADDRAARALTREAELEAVIGELREHLRHKKP